jgi:hypothetical protein
MLESIIIAKATQEAWDQAMATAGGNLVKAGELAQAILNTRADTVALQRMVATRLEQESAPEAFNRRLAAAKAQREAADKADLKHGKKLADLAAKEGAAMKAREDAARADMHRNGAMTAGM